MSLKFSNFMQGGLIFVLLIGIIGMVMTSIEQNYDISDNNYQVYENGTVSNQTILRHYQTIGQDFTGAANEFTNGIQTITNPSGNLVGALWDIGYGFIGAALGALKIFWTIATIPARILNVLVVFYPFPEPLIAFITTSILLSIAFVFVRILIKDDL